MKSRTRARVREQKIENVACGICTFLMVWFVASWFDVVANNMNGANYQWWNLLVMIFG
jgi:hypothetical protein